MTGISEGQKSQRETKVLVIGGGSTGTSILYYLARRGLVDSILIERGQQIASGQTSRSAAILRTHYSNPTLVRMAAKSYKFFEDFPANVRGRKCGFKKTGLIVGADAGSEHGLRENHVMHRQLGIDSKSIDYDEVKRIEPELDPKIYSEIVYEPEAGYAEPSTTASSFASAASELGCKVLTDTNANHIKRTAGGYEVTTSGGTIHAEKIILAVGVWFNQFVKMLNLNTFLIQPVRHPVCIFRRPQEYAGTRPIVFDFPRSSAFKPEGETDMNVSSLETIGGPVDPDNYNSNVSFDEISLFSARVAQAFPLMAVKGKLGATFTGLYDNTPDEQPVIDEFSDEGFENLYCLVGLSGHGFKLSPEFGRIMSTIVCGEKFTDYDISIFNKNRFREGKLIKSNYHGVATIG